MTLREAQDILWPLILERAKTKAKAARKGNYLCMYRVDGDAENMAPENCCFAGAMINPAMYSSELEDNSVGTLVGTYCPVLAAICASHDIPSDITGLKVWLRQVQNVHDEAVVCLWDKKLSEMAPGVYNANN